MFAGSVSAIFTYLDRPTISKQLEKRNGIYKLSMASPSYQLVVPVAE